MSTAYKILVTGGNGLLAHALGRLPQRDAEPIFLSHRDFDLLDPVQMERQIDCFSPKTVINTAAYNLVDRCEIEREQSWAANATGPEMLANICAKRGVRLVHFGTDYVFNGKKKAPYTETDTTETLNHYGAGKLAGEKAVLGISSRNLVLRTSWIFDWHPTQTKTFVHTVCRAASEGRALKSTTDQVSVPTFGSDLAGWTMALLQQDVGGLFHAVNDEGVSRYEWTRAILEEAANQGIITVVPPVEPVLSSFFNTTMRRPDYTVMNNQKLAQQLGQSLGSWRTGLRKMLAQMK